jgi:hypothetical protein
MNANPTQVQEIDVDFEWDPAVIALFEAYDRADARLAWEREQRHEADRLHRNRRIVVPGKCPECREQSPDVAATEKQVISWFTTSLPMEQRTEGFMKYQVAALTQGLHRECIQPYAERVAAKEAAAKRKAERAAERAEKAAEKARAEAREVVIKRVTTRKNSRRPIIAKAS